MKYCIEQAARTLFLCVHIAYIVQANAVITKLFGLLFIKFHDNIFALIVISRTIPWIDKHYLNIKKIPTLYGEVIECCFIARTHI